MILQDQQTDGLPEFIHIERNEFVHRKHKKQKEEDIAICDCKYDDDDPDSACADGCLNVLTNTECTPGYCPCVSYCRNQRFQKCENAKAKLFKTEGRGWGLLADENIKAGQFIIEYCGEVISCKEARRRSHAYESQGLLDAYIILLNAHESIDATKKGSFARFINHSCQPNCETRKWNVLGELRVGIFAKHDIPVGTELAYDYNFQWYGGAKVRCRCGASCCSGFLGAKSRGFQEDTYLWDNDDVRYSVENIPTYDSEEDEPISKLPMIVESSKVELTINVNHDTTETMDEDMEYKQLLQSTDVVESLNSTVPMEEVVMHGTEIVDNKAMTLHQHDNDQNFGQKNVTVSPIKGNSAYRNSYTQTKPLLKKKPVNNGGRSKHNTQKEVDVKRLGQLLASKEAREEIYSNEEKKKQATSQLELVYDEIRPAIEEHERDSQDSVSTSVAERWIEASCAKMRAEFDLYSSIIKQVTCNPQKRACETETAKGDEYNDDKLTG